MYLFFLFCFVCIADVLSEEAILKWYTEGHVAKGKSVFLEQMKKFVEWLKNAEEGKAVSSLSHASEVQFSDMMCHSSVLWSILSTNHYTATHTGHVILQEVTAGLISSLCL